MSPNAILYFLAALIMSGCSDNKEESTQTAPVRSNTLPLVKTILFPAIPPALGQNPFIQGGLCYVDSVNKNKPKNSGFSIKHSEDLSISGWAINTQDQNVPPTVVLKLASGKENYHAILSRQSGRDGLAKKFGKSEYSHGGLTGQIDASVLPSGHYDISIIQATEDKNLVCPTQHKLIVK